MSDVNLAVDLGTTNIEIALVRGDKIICSRMLKNRQSLYGSDVINRIAATIRDKKHLFEMRNMVLSDLKDAFMVVLSQNGYKPDNVGNITICGNTTMISILLYDDISDMGSYPFNHRHNKSVIVSADTFFDDMFTDKTEVFLSGCVSSFIGGDILAGLYYLKEKDKISADKISLFVDMGTNGEIILSGYGKCFGTSTACGPAFEGCTRKQNVYGSSTIDAISLGVASKKISSHGILNDEYIEKGITIAGVHIDMDIIQNILVAKAGIYTGISLLSGYAGFDMQDIDRVYIAGGFGFYLNHDSGFNIGLLPECFENKIKVVGNTSVKGAALIGAQSFEVPHPTDNYDIDVLQLANDKNFQKELMENMLFVRK